MQRRVELWERMGVRGIFLDEAGYDFGVTRDRQNAVIDFIHQRRLSAFANAYNPADLFSAAPTPLNASGGGNPAGTPGRLGRNDLFLLESYQLKNGRFEDAGAWHSRTREAVKYRDASGARVFAITTTTDREAFSAERLEYAWWSALLWGLDGFGWGEPLFSSRDSVLPWRARPAESEAVNRHTVYRAGAP